MKTCKWCGNEIEKLAQWRNWRHLNGFVTCTDPPSRYEAGNLRVAEPVDERGE